MTVYADVLVITNLYVDYFLLWCTRRALGLRPKGWRLGAGALAGGLCALVCLIPRQPWWLAFGWGAASALLVTGAAFWPLPPGRLAQAAVCFWGFSLALAGFFLFLIRWVAPGNLALVGHSVYVGISPGLLFAFTGAAYLVLWGAQRLFPREDLSPRLCRLLVEQGGKQALLWAKADTGCALREPFSGLPVVVCQKSALAPLLPPGWEETLPLRLVPFESLGGSGVLPAFRPEKVCRMPQGTPLACYVALWDRDFPPGDCQALFGPDQFPELTAQ